jgi:hypothetical protein
LNECIDTFTTIRYTSENLCHGASASGRMVCKLFWYYSENIFEDQAITQVFINGIIADLERFVKQLLKILSTVL